MLWIFCHSIRIILPCRLAYKFFNPIVDNVGQKPDITYQRDLGPCHSNDPFLLYGREEADAFTHIGSIIPTESGKIKRWAVIDYKACILV